MAQGHGIKRTEASPDIMSWSAMAPAHAGMRMRCGAAAQLHHA